MERLHISDKGDCMKLVLNPAPTAFVKLSGSESIVSYLSKCKQNIMAELWGFYCSKINQRSPRWRSALMDVVHFDVSDHKVTFEDASVQDELAWNLVLYLNRLCILCPKRNNNRDGGCLILVEGKLITDPYESGGAGFCHVLGYIRPYIRDLEAIETLSKQPPLILNDIAAPSRSRTAFGFRAVGSFSATVPSNPLQRSIISSLASTLECIQGPPGTGKSTTIFHIVSTRLPEDYKAIVTCVQNKAVDSIAEKLGPNVDELPFVVIGRPGRLGDEASRFTVEAQAQRSSEVAAVKQELKKAEHIYLLLTDRLKRRLDSRISATRDYWIKRSKEILQQDEHQHTQQQGDGHGDPWRRWWEAHIRRRYSGLVEDIAGWQRLCDGLKNRVLPSALREAKVRIMESARVILGTLDGLASADAVGGKTIAIVDEAGTVPEFKVPLLVSFGAQAIVAIGDQNQLQPFTYHTKEAPGFFQRVVGVLGEVPMLREQYRMHPAICSFVSKHFYSDLLTTNPVVAGARGLGKSISWRDYPDTSAESDDAKKRCNPTEVLMLSQFMEDELPGILKSGQTVAVITFYKHQFGCLMDAAEGLGLVRSKTEMKQLAKKGLSETVTRFKHPNFRIVTVDAAQGSEADVVVLSCVRCNVRRDLGFLTNRNRMCVALSRAKERLVIVASSRTLKSDLVWRSLFEAR